MRIYQTVKIGELHTNHCEDYAVIESIGNQKMLFALMDGCTMGTDSYFASTLVGKLLRKIAVERSYQTLYDKEKNSSIEDDTKEILKLLMLNLKQVKNTLLLKDDELLCTLVLLIIDFSSNTGQIFVIGDGVVCINGNITEFEQDNIPDYLGYHLGEDFEDWYKKQKQVITINDIRDISISSDGIFTFEGLDKRKSDVTLDPVNYLLIDKEHYEIKNMLTKKINNLEEVYGLRPTDDISIIRIINNN